MADLFMVIHGVALWIALSFWVVLTWAPVTIEEEQAAATLWWIVTVCVGILTSTFYVFQMR